MKGKSNPITQFWKPQEMEKKWQDVWMEKGIYEPQITNSRKPFYNLMMFPYPSAEGLHVGNMFAFVGSDIYGRYRRMKGDNVFEPIGLDGFGIHSENYALKIGQHPMELAKRTQERFYKQLQMTGNAYAWSHKLETYDPDYYRWTQWIFIKLFKKGLAYKSNAKVNWCPHCKTVLADEQVIKKNSKYASLNPKQTEGAKAQGQTAEIEVCERCETRVERKDLSQWFFRITGYAQKLLDNLEELDWSEKVKVAQRNWLGKSEGAKVMFQSDIESDVLIDVFTTRPDTLFGVTFLVLAPEHPLVTAVIDKSKGSLQQEIRKYVDYSLKKTEEERIGGKNEGKNRVKSGIFTGFYAINPVNKKRIPIFVADYVVMSYGTGAVMGVPAHDQRDYEFAKKYNLDILEVIEPVGGEVSNISQKAFTSYGRLVNSGEFSGLNSEDGIRNIIKYMEKHQKGSSFATWHIRDWIISRQRYWGPPIPMIYCEKCAKDKRSWFTKSDNSYALSLGYPRSRDQRSVGGIHKADRSRNSEIAPLRATSQRLLDRADGNQPDLDWDHYGWYPVPEEDLPLELPYIEKFKPTGTGVSPLAQDAGFVKVKCPECGSQARRETDVSDTFLDSAWYFLRYPSINSKYETPRIPWDAEITKKWLPVDMYIGGAEHAVLHLLYSRFLTMVFCDLGLIGFDEPFSKFRAHGLLIKDGAKMSKSKGNVINPDEYIAKYGADTLRCYLMFCGRFSEGGDFRDTGIEGMQRFLKRVWRLVVSLDGHSLGRDQRSDKNLNEVFGNQNPKTALSEASAGNGEESLRMMHKTIKKVGNDIETLDYNTAIAAVMEWMNFLEGKEDIESEEVKSLLLLLAPFAPFMCEELWQSTARGNADKFESIHTQAWPDYDENKIRSAKTLLVVQVDGRVRDKVEIEAGVSKEEAEEFTAKLPNVSKYLGPKYAVVYVPDRIINFVTR